MVSNVMNFNVASIFERVAAGESVMCPKYIADALTWLQDELDPAESMTP